MLHQSESLAPLGRIAGQQRERLDGSGYPGGLAGAAISREARILGAADAYQAKIDATNRVGASLDAMRHGLVPNTLDTAGGR